MPAQPETPYQSGRGQLVLFWCGIALLLVLLGFTLLPTLNLGFVADDFFLLVPDQKLPLTQSADELHRPLRNATIKIVAGRLGIRQVLPYRLLIALTFVAILVLLFRLTRQLGANRLPALAAVFVLAFCPRNREVLYWFAAWQDLVAAAAVLLACLFFLDFRESARPYALIVAAIGYLIGLGFKETAVVLPVLLVSIDFYRERSISAFTKRSLWRAYIPFACIMLVYVVYFLSQSGLASLAGHRTEGYYGFHGVGGAIAGIVRALINIALPFSRALGLKDIRWWHVAVLLFESIIVLLLVWRFRAWPALMLAASWLVWTILPTATFAAAFNADRYLFVPTLGAAVFAGLLLHAMVVSPEGTKSGILACVALALYTSVGFSQLVSDRELWRKAGSEVAAVIGQTMRLCSRLPAGSEVDFVNVTHSLHPLTPVFANGLSESLHANGLPSSLRILRNFASPDSEQQRLVANLMRCDTLPPEAVRSRTMLIDVGGRILKLDTGCASGLVDSDRAQRPMAWNQLYPSP
jgi:hypothetical protein